MNRPRVLLADDHPLFLTGLQALLDNDCEVVGTPAFAAAASPKI